MSNVFDDVMSIHGRGFSRVSMRNVWTDGEVITRHGIVSVYAQGGDGNVKHSRLDFVWQGKLYMRNFNGKRYTPRGLATKAIQFAEDISGATHE